MSKDFLYSDPKISPTIYAYELVDVPDYEGLIKIGYTDRDVDTRIKEQLGTSKVKHKKLFEESENGA